MAKGKCEVTGMMFRPAKGGVISTTEMRTHRGGSGGGPNYDQHSEETVHPTMEHAAAHMKKHLGHAFGGKETAKEEAAESEG